MTIIYQAVVCLSDIWGEKDSVTVGVFSNKKKAEQAASVYARAFTHITSVEVEKFVLSLVLDKADQEACDHYLWCDEK